VGRGLLLAAAAIAIGLLGARLLSGVLTSMLNDVKPTDASVYAGITVAVLSVATLASYLPARAASRVDPTVVLRDS
jgi:ABC-type antimicrobial peptide transport system permease subunit